MNDEDYAELFIISPIDEALLICCLSETELDFVLRVGKERPR